jgi:lipid-binding SYLF domain-containing protein
MTHSLQAQLQKKRKCYELAFDVKQQLQLNAVIVIPLLLSAKGVIPSVLNQSLTTLN